MSHQYKIERIIRPSTERWNSRLVLKIDLLLVEKNNLSNKKAFQRLTESHSMLWTVCLCFEQYNVNWYNVIDTAFNLNKICSGLIAWGERLRAQPWFASTHATFFAVMKQLNKPSEPKVLPTLYVDWRSPVSRGAAITAALCGKEVKIKVSYLKWNFYRRWNSKKNKNGY